MKKEESKRTGDLGRRDLMKMGVSAGVAMAMPAASVAAPQEAAAARGRGTAAQAGGAARQAAVVGPPTGDLRTATTRGVQQWPNIVGSRFVPASTLPGYTVHTGPGWVNNSGRAFGNGPMDETTRRITDFVDWYSESRMSPELIETINYLMADTLAVMYCAFEAEPLRIVGRLASRYPGPSTLVGYGVKTTEEWAAFGNAAFIRYTDFNAAPHNNELMGAVLAVGEAHHATGPQIMAAITIAYEIVQKCSAAGDAVGPGHVEWDNTTYHAVASACAAGKMMGLNKDQMANAISLALTPHNALYSHIGIQSMWKGLHSSEMIRTGVWAALMAGEGMTAPAQPFDGRDGLLSHQGPYTRDLVLASHDDDVTGLQALHGNGGGYKRVSSEGNTQEAAQILVPAVREWCKAEEIDSMDLVVRSIYQWQEVCDPPKWDPRNKETADHSLPYNIARNLLDGYIYMDSFSKEKYMDPKVRELMNRITCRPNVDEDGSPQVLTVKKKNGETKVFRGGNPPPMQHDEFIAKYNKAADYGQVDKDQAARVLKYWMNLKDCKDIGEGIAMIAKFGKPRPLSDKTPAAFD